MALENLKSAFSNIKPMNTSNVGESRQTLTVVDKISLLSTTKFPILDNIQRGPNSFVKNNIIKLYDLEKFDPRPGRPPSGLVTNINTYMGTFYEDNLSGPIEQFGMTGLGMDELLEQGKDLRKTQSWSKLYNSNHTPKRDVGYNYSQFVSRDKLDIRSADRVRNYGSWSRFSSIFKVAEPYIVSEIGEGGRRKNRGFRASPTIRALTDVERILKFMGSARGIQFMFNQQSGYIPIPVVRRGNKLDRVFQRYSTGYNPLGTIVTQLSRLFGEAVPTVLYKKSEPPDMDAFFQKYGIVPPAGRSTETNYDVNDTFTQGGTGKTYGVGGFAGLGVGYGPKKVFVTGDKHMIHDADTTFSGIGDTLEKALGTDVYNNVTSVSNGMPFYFKDLRDNRYITFRAYITGLTENISPSWSSTNYIGRSEPVYVYERAEREVNFELKVFAQTQTEFSAMWRKLTRLTSLCYPEYKEDTVFSNPSKTRMKPPLTQMRIGDMFGSTDNEVTGFIKSLSISVPDEGIWETSVDQALGQTVTSAALPKYIIIAIGYQVIHSSAPSLEMVYQDAAEKFYGGARNDMFALDTKSS